MAMRERLRRLAASIAGDESAEDVVHDAFCKLWEAHPLVADELQATRLSYTVVRNAAIDSYRRATRRAEQIVDDIPDTSDEEIATGDVYEAVIAIARRKLSSRGFLILKMHDMEGMGYEEIAETLSMTQENVRVTLSRARKTVRELYRNQQI